MAWKIIIWRHEFQYRGPISIQIKFAFLLFVHVDLIFYCFSFFFFYRIAIPLLQKYASAHHECSVIFFTPGRFKTSIQCYSKPQQQAATAVNVVNPSLSRSSCPLPESSQLNPAQILINDISGATSYHEQQEHVWKFIPPIEVTVVEQ